MGPHPHLVTLAQEALQTEMEAGQVTEKIFNGKLMELKGKMLQQGLTQTMAVNLTLEEYRHRLEMDNKADPLVEEEIKTVKEKGKKTRAKSPIPLPIAETLSVIDPKSTAMGSDRSTAQLVDRSKVKSEPKVKESVVSTDVMVVSDSEEEKPGRR